MLQNHVSQFKGGEVIRSRKPDVLATCDIVVDVGGVYDPSKMLFDHHQKTFVDTFGVEPFTKTRLSSAGLIYKHFGKEVLSDILRDDKLSDDVLQILYMKVYETFVEAVDGVDNGVNQYEGDPAYDSSTDLGSRVSQLNPWWNVATSSEEEYSRFLQAMALTGKEFRYKVEFLARSWWPARAIVQEAIDSRKKVHPSGKIIQLPQRCPWKKHFFEIEEEQNLGEEMLYCLFKGGDQSFRIQAIPKDRPDNFDNRKPLPKAWRGVRDEELSKLTGVPDCVFVHASGFIGGTKSMETALELAKLALEIE